jgi:HSP20 family protein
MANILKQDDWDIRREMAQLQREMNRMTRRALGGTSRRQGRIFPSIIISATDDRLVLRAEIPGMKLDDFDITVSSDTLTVQGTRTTGEELAGGWYHRRERRSGAFSRAVRLPAEVDGDRAEASYLAGVLAISLPLKEPAKPQEIPVQVVEG